MNNEIKSILIQCIIMDANNGLLDTWMILILVMRKVKNHTLLYWVDLAVPISHCLKNKK
jgi:hypothetical protein